MIQVGSAITGNLQDDSLAQGFQILDQARRSLDGAELKQAQKIFSAWIAAFPDDPAGHYGLARANLLLFSYYSEVKKDSAQARSVFEQAMIEANRAAKILPSNGQVHALLGRLYQVQDSLHPVTSLLALVTSDSPVVIEFRRTVRLDPQDPEAMTWLAVAFRENDDLAEARPVDLHAGLESTLEILRPLFRDRIMVDKEFGSISNVIGLSGQLNQVFMDLLANAGEAIADEGRVWIKTWQEGDQVFVSVRDSGPGIPPENLSKVYDPFFTTKEVGKGTGLGLSIAYGIVEKHGGEIRVESLEGQGACFTVSLPIRPSG